MLRALLVLVSAVGMTLAPMAYRIAGFGTPIGEVGSTGPAGPEQPSGFAFAIWGVIFALALVYALRQMLPSRRDAALYQSVGTAAFVLFATAIAWMLVAQFRGNGPILVGLIWLMLLAAMRGFYRTLAMRPALDQFDRVVTLPMFALFTGWLAAAVWLNTGSVAKDLMQASLGAAAPPSYLTPTTIAAAIIICIAAMSLLLLRRAHGYVPLGLTTLWALGGIAHANLVLRPNTTIAMLCIVLALVVVAILLWQRRPVKRPEF